jgi:putative chitinase
MNLNNLKSKLPLKAFDMMVSVVEKYDITSSLRLAHFMAQTAHESGNFHFMVENMNYSVSGLLKTFPKYFPTKILATEYARKPVIIGSRVYANRMGNGDEASQQGFLFRGRGYLQLTGKSNYADFSEFIGEDCVANPDLVATKYPMDSAIWFFDKNNIWEICDRGAENSVVSSVTRKVNGGTNGLQDRLEKFKLFHGLLNN